MNNNDDKIGCMFGAWFAFVALFNLALLGVIIALVTHFT